MLPIGISFFTFTQIAFLVDTYHGKVREPRFVPYLLFVTLLPAPDRRARCCTTREMMPQFAQPDTYRLQHRQLRARGSTFFGIGLFKKVILADGIAALRGAGLRSGPATSA